MFLVLLFVSAAKFKKLNIEWITFEGLPFVTTLQDKLVEFVEEHYGVHWATFSLASIKVLLRLWVCPLIGLKILLVLQSTYIFAGSTTASTRGRGCPLFTVGACRMLLLCVGVECRITEVGLVAVLTFVVPTIDIVLTASAASRLFEAFILVAVTLTIITALFAIVVLIVLFV
jgi:hypothetical protein